MSEILHNNFTDEEKSYEGGLTKEPVQEKASFLDNFFKYAEKSIGLYKTATSDKTVQKPPAYSVELGEPVEKKVLGMTPVAGYIIIASVITLVVFVIYKKTKDK